MMRCDRLAHAARATVDHQPQPILFVGLELDKVIASTERAELKSAVTVFQASPTVIRQRRILHACWQRFWHGLL